MNTKQLFLYGASMLAAALAAAPRPAGGRTVRPGGGDRGRSRPIGCLQGRGAGADRRGNSQGAGVLVLYAVSEKDNPTHVKVFEIYRDRSAYEAHLGSDHFKKYKTTVEKMVKSLKLMQATPIMLGAKSK
jgi:Uncharacterized conserved protein